jgi:uncharacterized repeat protein (TIGR03809 family)
MIDFPRPSDFPHQVPQDLMQRYLALAERRRAHLSELYSSGRWKLYHSETQFRVHVRRAVDLCNAWREIAGLSAEPERLDTMPPESRLSLTSAMSTSLTPTPPPRRESVAQTASRLDSALSVPSPAVSSLPSSSLSSDRFSVRGLLDRWR